MAGGLFCSSGGCTAKLGPDILERVLSRIERGAADPNLLVGFDSSDDAAVYRVSDEVAVVQTLDFFPPMLEDPYVFGQIAATNALSDVYAMGGEVISALNIVCFPQDEDLNVLGEIMRGGSEKVVEAGAVLCGGHSINDKDVKYGLSVNGVVHPDRIYKNNGGQAGDDPDQEARDRHHERCKPGGRGFQRGNGRSHHIHDYVEQVCGGYLKKVYGACLY